MQRLARMRSLPPRGTGLLMGRAGERRFGKPRPYGQRLARHPLNISVKHYSDSYAFSIAPKAVPVLPYGTLTAISIRDIETGEWFEWNNGFWTTRRPEVTIGPNLYIEAWAVNEGEAGVMQVLIRDDVNAVLAVKQETVAAVGTLGAETGTKNMPNRTYGIMITVEP